MKVFWDTNLFIYLIERHPALHQQVLRQYEIHKTRSESIITSTFTLGELIAQPLRKGRADLVRRYTEILMSGRIELIAFTTQAAEAYGRIRAETSLKQPDAIQIACAIAGGAKRFLTNDRERWGADITGMDSISGLNPND